MSIQPIKGLRGQEQALCKCNECCAEVVVNAAHNHSLGFQKGAGGRNGRPVLSLANERQVTNKLQSQGWTMIKGVLRCPKCEEKRKPKEIQVMAVQPIKPQGTAAPIRQPTQKQIRLIILALEDAYDDAAKRYKGQHTDKSIAVDLGDGIMPAWVAEQREKLFGPAGNEELFAILNEIEAVKLDVSNKLAALERRVAACVESHDRRMKA